MTTDEAVSTISAMQQMSDDRPALDVVARVAPALFTCVDDEFLHSDGSAIVVHRVPCPGWYTGCTCHPIFVRHPVRED